MRSVLKAACNLFGQEFKGRQCSEGRNAVTYKLGSGAPKVFPLLSVQIKTGEGKQERTECRGSRAVTAWGRLHPGFVRVGSLFSPQSEFCDKQT